MKERNKLPPLDVLFELLIAFPEDGKLYWKRREPKWFASERSCRSWNTKYAGKEAFTNTSTNGYKVSTIQWVHYPAHRVIWAMHYGECPPDYIDHINGEKSDNRISNLQAANASQNIVKAMKRAGSKHSKYKGVSFSVRDNRWLATATSGGARHDLGRFLSEDEAASAYNNFVSQNFGTFATLNEVSPL